MCLPLQIGESFPLFRLRPKALTPAQTNEILTAKLKWILSGCQPVKIILFGSAARNEMTDQSDVDIALLFSTAAEVKVQKKLLYKTPGRDLWPQDLFFLSEEEFSEKALTGGICEIIASEGKVLYERSTK
jgi:predicted nucleotidyltransferase